ncbi:MAG: hypothetical protein ACYC9O_11720, partial [Candidatus Latescibacterota bacterium]
WGELGDKYYTARRIGAFLESFGTELVGTLPAAEVPVQAPRGVSVLQRQGERSVFVFPRNLTRSAQQITFRLTLPDGTDLPFPSRIPLFLGPQRMKMLPVNVSIGKEITLVYSTSEVFGTYRIEDETVLVVYGDPGERGEILLRGAPDYDHIRGEASASDEHGGLLVSYLHRAGAFHLMLMARDEDEYPAALRGVRIIVADRETVEHTWIIGRERGRLPVLSNLYFAYGAPGENAPGEAFDRATLRFAVSRLPGGERFLEFPCAANAVIPPTAFLEDVEVPVTVDRRLRTVRVSLPAIDAPESNIALSPWKMREENPLAIADAPGWKPYRAFFGNERSGEYGGGYYTYHCRFVFEGDARGMRLLLTELHDNADVWLNGAYLGGGSAVSNNGLRLALDASGALRRGENELFALVENEARPRKGDDATFTGVTGPVALTAAEKSIPLREWRRGFLAAETESALGAIPAEALPGFDDTAWERIEVRPGWDSRLVIPPTSTHIEPGHERIYAVYRTTFTLPADRNGKGVILETGKCDGKCWIYLNGTRVDKKHQETFAADLTPQLREGKNTLALVIRNFRWYTTVGLHGEIRVRLVDRVLAEGWEFIRGLPGQREFFHESKSTEWLPLEGPEAPSRVWLAAEFEHHPTPGWTEPLGLRLSGWNAKTLIYLNGFLAGRYHPEGPQEVFYLPGDRLRERNRLVLFCNAHDAPAQVGEAEVKPYCMVKESVLEVRL